ncbi:MAG: hypothetical protein WD135_08170, partial [Ferruginibacter sp.]
GVISNDINLPLLEITPTMAEKRTFLGSLQQIGSRRFFFIRQLRDRNRFYLTSRQYFNLGYLFTKHRFF